MPTFAAFLLKPAAFLSLAVATAALAQSPNTGPDAVVLDPTQGNCPIGISANLQARGQTIWTIAQGHDRVSPQQTYGAGVHVDLRALKHNAIQNVSLSVAYLAPGLHLQAITQFSAAPVAPASELSKTFHLVSTDTGTRSLSGDLLVGPAAVIQRVKLLSVQYADGTEWHSSSTNRCSIEPSRILLVAIR